VNILVANIDFDALAAGLINWLQHALLFGTGVALVTWLVLSTIGRRLRPAIHAGFWLVVLLKFIVPVGPSFSYSMASTVHALGNLWPAAADTATSPPTAAPGVAGSVIVVGLEDVAAPQAAAATTTTRRWPVSSALVGAYLIGILVAMAIKARAYLRFAQLCRSLPRADPDIHEVVRDVCARIGARRVPSVHVSDEAPAPFIFGVLRPTLVLSRRQLVRRTLDMPGLAQRDPSATADGRPADGPACQGRDELEAVILHEVAHLRRGDLWVRQLQWVAGTLLFFWPVVAWVNRRIDLAREHACDEWALRYGRLSAGDYARCLLNALQPVRASWRAFRPAAMAANRKTVERRIDMILASHCAKSGRLFGLGMLGLVAGWGAFVLTGAAVAECPPEEGGSEGEQEDVMVFVAGDEDCEHAEGEFTFEVHALEADPIILEGGMIDLNLQIEGDPTGGDADLVINGGQKIALPRVPLPIFELSSDKLAEFLTTHPTADANGDGELTKTEFDAYHVALAMSNPAAVLAKFPKADRNEDSRLDASEAARLVSGGMFMRQRSAGPATWTAEAPAGGAVAAREMHVAMIAHADKRAMHRAMAGPYNREAVQWLQENVLVVPATAAVASYIEAVEQAPFAELLAHKPELDTNGDGKLSAEEHDAFVAEQQKRVHARILQKHPEADTNGDGELTEDEMISLFHKDAKVRVAAPDGLQVEGEGSGKVRVMLKKIEVNDAGEPEDN